MDKYVPSHPFSWLDPEGPELGLIASSDADRKKGSSLGDVIQAGPLDRQEYGMAERKTGHTDSPKADILGASRDSREQNNSLKTGLVNKTVSNPDRFEHTGLFGQHGSFQEGVH
jgi:hypothetical protein